MNQDLYNFIHSELSAGKSPEQVAKALNATGHTAEEIDEIIQEMYKAAKQQSSETQNVEVRSINQAQQAVPQQNFSSSQPNPPQQVINRPPVTNTPVPSITPPPQTTSKSPKIKSFFSKLMAFYHFLFPPQQPDQTQQGLNPPPVTNAPATMVASSPQTASNLPVKKSFFSKLVAIYNIINS